MKQYTIGVFLEREAAEKAVNRLHQDLSIGTDEISYVYRNTEGEVKEVDTDEVSGKTVGEGAADGAKVGGGIGAALGLATVVGMIPVIGPVFAAGPIVAALGIGTGVIGTTAAGALTGAAAGGLVGALVSLGVSEEKAKEYHDRVEAGSVLIAVHEDESKDVASILNQEGATDVDIYRLA